MSYIDQEMETHDPHSSSSSSTSQNEEVNRNWLELPLDVISLIFLKLNTIDILVSAQWVCSSWWKLSKQPHLFRSIHVERFLTLYAPSIHYSFPRLSENMAIEAVDRSCGQLVKFSVKFIATDKLLHYMSQRSSSLRCIRLVSWYSEVSEDGLIEMAKKLPHLEELDIIDCFFSKNVCETIGCFCPRLKSCRVNYVNYSSAYDMFSGVPVAIAQNMPELRCLNLFGNILLTDDCLKAVLDGCRHLKSLDLRECYGLEFAGDLKERCGNIEVIRLPYDPTDDFEYENLYPGY